LSRKMQQEGMEPDAVVTALLTCMPNLGALRMLGEYSAGCPCVMWLLGPP
jgi:hypothetical protein